MAKGISLLGSGQNKVSSGSAPNEDMFIPRACDGKSLADLPLDRVHPDPQQPRTWAEDELDELQAKIEGAGKILQPITVIPRADMPGHYLIKTGEGRWRVAGRLGWGFIPSVIEDLRVNSDTRQVFAEEAAVMLGLNETKISRYRKLLTANEEIQEITPQLTNINTLGYLIDLSRLDDGAYTDSLEKIKSGELVNAEKYLKDLVSDIKNPDKPKAEIWDDGVTSELDDAKLISTIKGAGADGIAVIKLMQANGDAISFKLDYENQIKLRWLLNKCLDK